MLDKKYLNGLIEELIYLKDTLKRDGYSWQDYECINHACNVFEEIIRKDNK